MTKRTNGIQHTTKSTKAKRRSRHVTFDSHVLDIIDHQARVDKRPMNAHIELLVEEALKARNVNL